MLVEALRVFTMLLLGIVLGVVVTLLLEGLAPEAVSLAALIGAVTGLALFVLFVLLRSFLVTAAIRRVQRTIEGADAEPGEASPRRVLVTAVLQRLLPDDATLRKLAEDAIGRGNKALGDLVSAGAAVWAAMTSLALAAAVAGGVVSLASVVVGQRQVERLTAQNELIETQIYESRATRVSSVFAAQLPALLEAIAEARPAGERARWEVRPDLVARIQAILNLAEPYATDTDSDEWLAELEKEHKAAVEAAGPPVTRITEYGPYGEATLADFVTTPRLYSPERGQLLVLLIGAGFPFDDIPGRLDFSAADLRNLTPAPGIVDTRQGEMSLGRTILRSANMRNVDLQNIDLSGTDLRGTILPRPDQFSPAVSAQLIGDFRYAGEDDDRIAGADLTYAILSLDDAMTRFVADDEPEILLGAAPEGLDVALVWKLSRSGDFALLRPDQQFRDTVLVFRRLLRRDSEKLRAASGCDELPTEWNGMYRAREGVAAGKFIRLRLGQINPLLIACLGLSE